MLSISNALLTFTPFIYKLYIYCSLIVSSVIAICLYPDDNVPILRDAPLIVNNDEVEVCMCT